MTKPALLITGAAGTIGRALTLALAKDSEWAEHRFVLTSTDRNKLVGLGEQVQALGHQVENFSLDLCDEAATGLFFENNLSGLAPFSAVVLIAGDNIDKSFLSVETTEWERLWTLNAACNARLLQSLSRPGMLSPNASAVLVGSSVGLRGSAGQAPYAASKGALMDIIATMAPHGLRVNVLLPPLVESPLLAHLSPAVREHLFSSCLLVDPDAAFTCAAHGVFLLSRRASYIHRTAWQADSRVNALGFND